MVIAKRDALSGLERKGRSSIRPVSQVALKLTDSSAFQNAIAASVRWMNERKRCNGLIPADAATGAPFDLGYSSGSMPAASTMLLTDEVKAWACRLDYPDAKVGQRTWSTEISIIERGGSTLFLSRLTNITLGDDVPYSPSVPGIVYRILSMFSVEADGYAISEEADDIDVGGLSDFISLVRSPTRELPVVAISRLPDGSVCLDPDTLVKRVAGAAHVAILSSDAAWELTRRLGRHLTVYNGAVRMYLPSSDIDSDDPYRHPVHRLKDGDGLGYANWLARVILPATFVRPRENFESARFSNLRAIAASNARSQRSGSSKRDGTKELIESLQKSLEALRAAKVEDAEAAQALLDEAADAQELISAEKNELASENARLRAKLRALALKSDGHAPAEPEFQNFEQFESWADAALGEHVEILPRALREIEKRGVSEVLEKFKDTMICIRDHYVPMKIEGGLELKRKFEERCRELHIEETACFAKKGDINAFPEYRARYGSEFILLDRHFKFGTGYDLRSMFRIYFHWDEVNEVVVIGHMPSHLDNNNTQ